MKPLKTLFGAVLLLAGALAVMAPYHNPPPQPPTPETAERPAVAIAEVLFDEADPRAALVNLGVEAITLDGWFLCNRPAYARLPRRTLEPGRRLIVHLGSSGTDTETEVFLRGLPRPDRGADELALYRDGSFSSADSLVDYLQWGRAGQSPSREGVAIQAGIWRAGRFVDLAGLEAGQSLYYDGAGDEPGDYFAGPSALARGPADAVVLVHSLSDLALAPGTVVLAAGQEATLLNLAEDGVHDPVRLLEAAGNVAFGVSFAVRPGELTAVAFTPTAGTYTLSHRAHGHPIEATLLAR